MGSGKIKSIFFSEFHDTAGPKITYQFPEDYITKEFFDAIHIYIITKPELQSRLITVHAQGKKIVGCPVCIENKKYHRNALIFNLCFVFDADTRTTKYETCVRKLAGYLTQLELESNFLSDENRRTEIPKILKDILTNLNEMGRCSLSINAPCTMHLKLSSSIDEPRPVQDQDVPIFQHDRPVFVPSQWDLTTQQVLQYIDGYNHVGKIASEADIEINLVKACLQNLLHFDVITVISIFQYSNMYTTTDQIRMLAEDAVFQEECLKYVACKGKAFLKDVSNAKSTDPDEGALVWVFIVCKHDKSLGRALPLFRDVFMLYASLTPGFSVKDLCIRFTPHSLKVDEKKLIQFGLRKKIIRRLHCYPIKLPTPEEATLPSRKQQVLKYMNGTHSVDEISCKTGHNYKELEEFIDNDPSIITCWK